MQTEHGLYQELEEQLQAWGASRWGVADLAAHRAGIQEEYDHTWDDYPKAISIAVNFPKEIVNQLTTGPTLTYQAYYDIINSFLNELALKTALFLEGKGHKVFPVPASQRTGKFKQTAIFSHRLAGSLAGLGWVGKNLSLLNKQVGPRLRLVTVLTDAPLPTATPLAPQCPADCTSCKDACPVQALAGVSYQEGQPLEARFDYKACAVYLRQVKQSFGKEICGRCLAACPWGK